MRQLILVIMVFLSGLMAGCERNDGVPLVDDYDHPKDANGQPIDHSQFLRKYCFMKDSNDTCYNVRMAKAKKDMGTLPKGW